MPEEPTVETEAVEPKTFDEAYVRELRAEAKAYRLNLREAEKSVEALTGKVKKYEEGTKSEVERITEEKAALERALADKDREITESQIRAKVVSEAAKLNIVDIDAAYRLLDLSLIDEDPKSVTSALKSLVKEKPYLLKTSAPPTPGVGGRPIQAKKSGNEQFAEMLRQGARKR